MRFLDRPMSGLTPAMCDAEEARAKLAHAAYAIAVRSIKRLLESSPDLGDMGDCNPPANPAAETEEEDDG